jgi:hypothetical protein
MVTVGLLKPANRDLVQRTSSAEDALATLSATEPVYVEKWITADER